MPQQLHLVMQGMTGPRLASAIMFTVFGLTIGLWGGSVAEVSRLSSTSAAALGTAFVGYAMAGILGFAVAGKIAQSISIKMRLLGLIALTAASQFMLFQAGSETQLVFSLLIFGFLSSSVDLAMNSEALSVEIDLGRPVLSSFHGLASLGVAFGALGGSFLTVSFSPTTSALLCLFLFACAAAAVAVWTPNRGPTHEARHGSSWFLPDKRLIAIALILGASISAEVAATMFSAPTIAQLAPDLAVYAGFGASGYAVMQGTTRLTGDLLRHSFGDERLMSSSLVVALCGLLVVTASGTIWLTAAGFALIGLGTACIVPCCFALAPRLSGRPAAASISMISTISGLVRIPSPYLYGVAASTLGYATGFVVFAAIVAIALAVSLATFVSPRLRRPV